MYYQITGWSKHLGNIAIRTTEVPWRFTELFDQIIILESEDKYFRNNCKVVCNKNRNLYNIFPHASSTVMNSSRKEVVDDPWAWFNKEYSFKIDEDGITTIEHKKVN